MSNLRDRFLNRATTLKREIVTVPELADADGEFKIGIRELSIGEANECRKRATLPGEENPDGIRLMAELLKIGTFDPETEGSVFTADDVDALLAVDGRAFMALGEAIALMSNIEGDLDAGKDDSPSNPTFGSDSGSPSDSG